MPQPTARLGSAEARAGQLTFSRSARTVIVEASRRGRRQAVLLSWPAGATYLPQECYQPGEFDVVVGHVAGSPIYADVRRLALFADRRVLIDAEHSSPARPHPPLRARVMPSQRARGELRPGARDHRFEAVVALLTHELVRDLGDQFRGDYAPETIWACVRRAIHDLRGSVSMEALPEMATRLAQHRLTQDAQQAREVVPAAAS